MQETKFNKIAILLLCLVLAGPEFGIGLELIVLVDAFGIELFLFSLSVSLWGYWSFVKSKLEELDPYFFVSSLKDIRKCPALLAHAIPGSMGLFMFMLALTTVSM